MKFENVQSWINYLEIKGVKTLGEMLEEWNELAKSNIADLSSENRAMFDKLANEVRNRRKTK